MTYEEVRKLVLSWPGMARDQEKWTPVFPSDHAPIMNPITFITSDRDDLK